MAFPMKKKAIKNTIHIGFAFLEKRWKRVSKPHIYSKHKGVLVVIYREFKKLYQ